MLVGYIAYYIIKYTFNMQSIRGWKYFQINEKKTLVNNSNLVAEYRIYYNYYRYLLIL